ELVEHAVDPDGRHRGAGDGRQKRPAQRVAEGVAEARLQRLDEEPRAVLVDDLLGEGGALCDEHVFSSVARAGRYLPTSGYCWSCRYCWSCDCAGPPGSGGPAQFSSRYSDYLE